LIRGLFVSALLTWVPFHSTLYPYHLSQPSSFRHIVLTNAANISIDYFFPSKGSFVTNVNVVAQPGTTLPDERRYLRSLGGRHIHRSGWVRLHGRRLPLTGADFRSLAGAYHIEQLRFVFRGRLWQVTASYSPDYRRMRPLMLRMLDSFRTP